MKPTLLASDLVVEGHCGIREALPSDTVENSARHREAHDAEDGLHAKQQKQRQMPKCGAVHKMFLQHKDICTYILKLNYKNYI